MSARGDGLGSRGFIEAGLSWPSVRPPLQKHEIQPPAKLIPDLFEVGDTLEPKALVKPQRLGILRIDSTYHEVFAESSGPVEQCRHQDLPYPSSSAIRADVNAVLHGVSIAWTRTKVAERCKAGNA